MCVCASDYRVHQVLSCFAELTFSVLLVAGSEMSEYQNVVGGRLKLKGKALDVKEGGIKKKKKKQHREESSQIGRDELQEGLAHLHWLF